MEIKWFSAFIDQPADRFDIGTEFWMAVTNSTLSPARGERLEFATLLPPAGPGPDQTPSDPHLRVQRTNEAPAGIHLDLHVSSIAESVTEAEALGATRMANSSSDESSDGRYRGDAGYVTLASPAGMIFCFVPHQGESRPSPPVTEPTPHLVDQVSIDIPAPLFDVEVQFWANLTGWEPKVGRLDEFVFLARPPGMPFRVLLQRLGDETGVARAHLDVACGSHVDQVTAAHSQLGAETVGTWEYWTTLRDPAGQLYCLTARDPATGSLTS